MVNSVRNSEIPECDDGMSDDGSSPDQRPTVQPPEWYAEWLDHVARSSMPAELQEDGTVEAQAATPPVQGANLPEAVDDAEPSYVRGSIKDRLKTASEPNDEISKLLSLIQDDDNFNNIRTLVSLFAECHIAVEPFFVAIAKYIDKKKEKAHILSNSELVSLCALILNKLARTILFYFDEDSGTQHMSFDPFVRRNLEFYRTEGGGGYYCDPMSLAMFKNIVTYAKAELNGTDVTHHLDDMIFADLLPES